MRILIIAAIAAAGPAMAADYVQGHVRKDGTYVQPHYRSDANSTKLDNYSTQGNTNPFTGKSGTVDPYKIQPPRSSSYDNRQPSNSSYQPAQSQKSPF